MTGHDPDDHAAQDDAKVRRTWRIALGGLVLGIALAVLTGVLGGEGRVGLAVMLLVTAAGCGTAALYGAVTVLIDDVKERDPSRRRPIAAGVLFLLAAMLMAMVAGAGG